MASQIQLRDPSGIADPDYNLSLRWENTVSTPIMSATALDNGQAISDIYTLVFTKSGANVTCDVTCGEGAKNPYQDTGLAVTADDATANTNLVPGVEVVVSSSTVTGWTGKVSIGALMTSAGATTDKLNVGVIQAGNDSTAFRVAAVNIGGDDSVQTTIDAVPGLYWVQTGAGDVVAVIEQHTDDTREHLAVKGSYTITFANWADGAGGDAGYKTADILVDGHTAVTTALFDGTTRYQYGVDRYDDGNDYLAGLAITLPLSTDDPSAVSIALVVGDGDQWVELAADSGGSPGSYSTAALTLTEAGQTAGTVRAGQTAYFWFKWALPDDATPDDIRLFNLSTRGLTV